MYYSVTISYTDSPKTDKVHRFKVDKDELLQFIEFVTKRTDIESIFIVKHKTDSWQEV